MHEILARKFGYKNRPLKTTNLQSTTRFSLQTHSQTFQPPCTSLLVALALPTAVVVAGPVPQCTCPPPPPPTHTTPPPPPPPPPTHTTTNPPPPPPTNTPTPPPPPPSGPVCSSRGKAYCCNGGIANYGVINVNADNCQQANLGGLTGTITGLLSGVLGGVEGLVDGLL
ncbi:hypothetical protein VNI00_018586 [Paramarasmius palmivorus]|uniref:Hydrophobin n=1 Tax=Paramarasmius palmivorus TaxID=297713 RepID=A0AAW0AVP5_9AGAR